MKKHILFYASLFLVLGASEAFAQEENVPLGKHNNHYHYSGQLLPENQKQAAEKVFNSSVDDKDWKLWIPVNLMNVRIKLSAGINAINFLEDAAFWLQGQKLSRQHLSIGHLIFGDDQKHQGFPSFGISALFADGAEVGLGITKNQFAGQDLNLTYFALDLFGKYTFLQENLVSPYLKASYGRSSVYESSSDNGFAFGSDLSREVSPTVAFGVGAEINLTYDLGLFVDLSYRNAWEQYAQNHYVQSFGVFYKF
jgi:hypothetical protein